MVTVTTLKFCFFVPTLKDLIFVTHKIVTLKFIDSVTLMARHPFNNSIHLAYTQNLELGVRSTLNQGLRRNVVRRAIQ